MTCRHRTSTIIAALMATGFTSASAEVVTATPSYMELSQVHESDLSPDDLWARMIVPSSWWNDSHTFSGDAGNLSLDVTAGGIWAESWDGGSVAHGRVLMVQEGEGLRLDAPFGPLQGMGIANALTLTITPREGGGSNLNMVFIATGAEQSNLNQLAGPVDGVWAQSLTNLVASE